MADDPKNDEVEAVAVTGRPNDIPIQEPQDAPLEGNSTLTSRARDRKKSEKKQVAAAENKAVTTDETKAAKAAKSAKKG